MTHTNKFKATISFNGVDEPDTTNARNLEVIRLFQRGEFKVSSVTEKISRHNGKESFNFDVDFYSQFRSVEIEEIIEKFNQVFVIHSISEVKTK